MSLTSLPVLFAFHESKSIGCHSFQVSDLKEQVTQKLNFCWKCTHFQTIQDVSVYYMLCIKQWGDVKNILMLDLLLTNTLFFISKVIHWWTEFMWIICGLLWSFYQLFGLSFWRHPFAADYLLVSKWFNPQKPRQPPYQKKHPIIACAFLKNSGNSLTHSLTRKQRENWDFKLARLILTSSPV